MPPTLYGAAFSGGVITGSGNTGTDIADLTLPPGAYLLHAVVTGPQGTSDTLSCSLFDDAQHLWDRQRSRVRRSEPGRGDQRADTLGTITIPSSLTTDTVRLFCGTTNSTEVSITASYIAMPVTVGSFQAFTNTVGGGTTGPINGGWDITKNQNN